MSRPENVPAANIYMRMRPTDLNETRFHIFVMRNTVQFVYSRTSYNSIVGIGLGEMAISTNPRPIHIIVTSIYTENYVLYLFTIKDESAVL